jgi:nucleoid-associated protein YejK
MINEALIHSVILHGIGSKAENEDLNISESLLNLSDDMLAILAAFFMSPFKSEEYFNLSGSEVQKCVAAVFDKPENLVDESAKLADLLYRASDAKTKGGEFYAAYFRECVVDGETVEAVGLFKSENKETFLTVYPVASNYTVESAEGVSIRKLDKACMIFNTERENGYLVAVADSGKNTDWRNDFLQIKPRNDAYSKTKAMMQACRDFVSEQLPEEFEIDRADQIEILNRSAQYFKSHETFDRPEFETEVLQQNDLIESFRGFDEKYRDEKDIPTEMTFDIEPQAVKKNAKVFKSVLKLDKNFHIYIHGDRSMIEKGEDAGRKYYKVFYDTEY